MIRSCGQDCVLKCDFYLLDARSVTRFCTLTGTRFCNVDDRQDRQSRSRAVKITICAGAFSCQRVSGQVSSALVSSYCEIGIKVNVSIMVCSIQLIDVVLEVHVNKVYLFRF